MARQVAAVEPRSATAHLILGNLLREKSDLDLAIAALTKAAELAPGLPGPHLALGLTCGQRG